MSKRTCVNCGASLRSNNPGTLCSPCQEKQAEKRKADIESLHYDVEDMRVLLGLYSQEQVRRRAREKKLPPAVPGNRRWLWFREVVDPWIRSDHQISPANSEQAEAVLLALQLGWPVDRMTLYGLDPGNLITELKSYGYLQDKKGQP